ncbi:MAG: hypothetical protein HRT69_10355 [Flavobacteriaceae bacterium]|nr:hypothetical protein [Flavobacteriaceae bacterium]
MNKILLQIIAFVLFSTSVFAQIPKLDHIKNLKESKIIIGLSHNENLNINLTKMVNQYWNLCQIDGALPYKEAIQKAKNDDNTFVIFVSTMTSRGLKHNFDENWDFRLISSGKFVGLSNGSKKPLMRSYIPSSESLIPSESIAHGINFMQTIITSMIEEQKGAMKVIGLYKKEAKELANKTLYIPKVWLHKKLTPEIITKEYGSTNYKLVSYEEWKDAILNKKDGIAYVILIPVPIAGQYMFQHHIFDSATNQLYAISQSRVAVSLNAVNLSKANTGYITKKNIKKYKGVLSGKW